MSSTSNGRTRPEDMPVARGRHEVGRADFRDTRVVEDVHGDGGIAEARGRFGGVDVPATLVGMLAALAFLVLFGGLVGAAVGAIGYQAGLDGNERELGIGGLVGGLVALALAYVLGGWTAGRIARYDGPRNGLMTGVWTIVLAAVLSGLGAWLGAEYDVLARIELPQWFSRDALTAGAILSGVIAIATMLAAGALGGAWGERFHRRADAVVAQSPTSRRVRDGHERLARH